MPDNWVPPHQGKDENGMYIRPTQREYQEAGHSAADGGASADEPVYGEILNDGENGEEIVIAAPVPVSARMSAREKQRRAMALKLAGASYAQIAENLNYATSSGAHKAVTRAMHNSLQENASELRRIHYGRLEHMLMLVWPDVNHGETSAINTALSVMDRMERLFGLNVAEKVDINTGPRETVIMADGDKSEYIEALKRAIEGDTKEIVDAEIVEDENANDEELGISGADPGDAEGTTEPEEHTRPEVQRPLHR